MRTLIRACFFLVLTSGPNLFGADLAMNVTDKNYLDTQGFSVFLYDSKFDREFVDQKNTAMEMILHGQRIATNGDVRLMPTPEQWDAVPKFERRVADKLQSIAISLFGVKQYTLAVERFTLPRRLREVPLPPFQVIDLPAEFK